MEEYGESALKPGGSDQFKEKVRLSKPGASFTTYPSRGIEVHEDMSPPYDDTYEDAKYELMGRKRNRKLGSENYWSEYDTNES